MVLKLLVLIYGFQYQPVDQLTRLVVFPFFLLASVFLGIWFLKDDRPPLLENAKRGMKGGMIFTLLVALFSGVYYAVLDPHYFERLNQQRIERLEERQALAERKEDVEDPIPDQSIEEYRKGLEDLQETWQGPLAIMTVNLLLYTFLSVVSSLIIAVFERVFRRSKVS